jgi:hypothetical protein
MRLSESSLEAALLGVAYGAPLVLCSVLGRTPAARSLFPVLADLHASQEEVLAPLVDGARRGACLPACRRCRAARPAQRAVRCGAAARRPGPCSSADPPVARLLALPASRAPPAPHPPTHPPTPRAPPQA